MRALRTRPKVTTTTIRRQRPTRLCTPPLISFPLFSIIIHSSCTTTTATPSPPCHPSIEQMFCCCVTGLLIVSHVGRFGVVIEQLFDQIDVGQHHPTTAVSLQAQFVQCVTVVVFCVLSFLKATCSSDSRDRDGGGARRRMTIDEGNEDVEGNS